MRLLGFHGCDRELGERVLAGAETLRPSANDYDWLGSGIYFWENSPRRAMDWAEMARKNRRVTRGRVEKPFVIGAVLDLAIAWIYWRPSPSESCGRRTRNWWAP